MTVRVSVVLPDDSGPVDFDDASTRKSAHAEGAIDQDIASRDDFDVDDFLVAEAHDRAVAVILGDLLQSEIEILVASCHYFRCRRRKSFRQQEQFWSP